MPSAVEVRLAERGRSGSGKNFSTRSIYRTFSKVLLGVIVVTLLPHYAKLYSSTEVVTPALTVHAALYLCWFVLFAVQSHLSASGSIATHKKLGYLSLALVLLLVASGVQLLIGVMIKYDSSAVSKTSFIWGIFHTLICFSVFFALGFLFRKNLQAHKRLMLMASLTMISASVTRVAYLPGIPVNGLVLTLLSTYILLLTPVVMDRVLFKRVHPVLKWGVPIYLITQLLCIGLLRTTEIGRAVAFPF